VFGGILQRDLGSHVEVGVELVFKASIPVLEQVDGGPFAVGLFDRPGVGLRSLVPGNFPGSQYIFARVEYKKLLDLAIPRHFGSQGYGPVLGKAGGCPEQEKCDQVMDFVVHLVT